MGGTVVTAAAGTPLHAARHAEQRKRRKYANIMASGFVFLAFALETFGAWGPAAELQLRQLLPVLRGSPRVGAVFGHTWDDAGGAYGHAAYVQHRIGTALQGANAEIIIARFW